MSGTTQVLGLDGKLYHAHRTADEDQRLIVGYAHQLRHRGLSVRAVVAGLAEVGIRRSVGWTSGVLRTWTCPGCSGVGPVAPERSGGAS